MSDMENFSDSNLRLGFEDGLGQVTSGPANFTAGELARVKALYDKQRAAAYDTFDPSSDHIAPREVDFHLITRSSLHDSALRLLSDRLAELTTVVYSDNDETTASKIRNTNKRLGDFERTLGELRRHVCSLEHRVSMVVRQQQVQQAAGGGGHGRKILRVRSKKRKVAGGEAVDVSLGDGGGGGGGGAGGSAVAEELGEVESMLAEVMKRVGDFRIASGLDDIKEEGREPAGDEDTEMVIGSEDKVDEGKEVVKTE